MVGDLRDTVQGAQSGFEKLVGSIPGYKGYKERELRREADKILRTHLANRFDEQKRRLQGLMGQITSAGRWGELSPLEQATLRLERLIDRLRTASYGYAGWFDAVKIEQQQLDTLYEFDANLASGVDRVAEVMSALEGLAARGESTTAEVNALLTLLQELNDTFGRRTDAVMGIA